MDNYAAEVLEDLDGLDPKGNDIHALSEARSAHRDAVANLYDRARAARCLGLHELADGLQDVVAILTKAMKIADECFAHRLNHEFEHSKQYTRQMVACALAGHTPEGNKLAAAFAGVELDEEGKLIED